MEIHCHITGICEAPMSSSIFSVNFSWVFQSIVIPVRYHNKSHQICVECDCFEGGGGGGEIREDNGIYSVVKSSEH